MTKSPVVGSKNTDISHNEAIEAELHIYWAYASASYAIIGSFCPMTLLNILPSDAFVSNLFYILNVSFRFYD